MALPQEKGIPVEMVGQTCRAVATAPRQYTPTLLRRDHPFSGTSCSFFARSAMDFFRRGRSATAAWCVWHVGLIGRRPENCLREPRPANAATAAKEKLMKLSLSNLLSKLTSRGSVRTSRCRTQTPRLQVEQL